jgi:hypothetical protein
MLNNLTGSFRIEDPPTDDNDYPPAGFTWCADEFKRCNFGGAAEVVYGAQKTWTPPRSFTDGVDCCNNVFGDPLPGVTKKCYIKIGDFPGIPCAKEGDICSFGANNIATVYYGLYGKYYTKTGVVSSISCSNGPFGGDPYVGLLKACYYIITGTTNPPAQFNKTTPANAANNQPLNVTLNWSNSSAVNSYQYCYDTTNNSNCDTTWTDIGTARSADLSGLSPGTTHYWQVRATNNIDSTYADGNTWWSFSTVSDSEPRVSTTINTPNINFGDMAMTTVSLNNVPAEGYTSAEFTCTYNPTLLEAGSITIGSLFGADSVSAINRPPGGSFILAIAGSNGSKAITSGAAFTFSVKALQAGQTTVDCTARVSKGDGNISSSPSTGPAALTIGGTITPTASQTATSTGTPTPSSTSTPTATPTPSFTPSTTASVTPGQPLMGTLTGQVFTTEPVIVRLYDATNTLIVTIPANPEGAFGLTAPTGTYIVVATASGFLSAQKNSVTVTGGIVTTLPAINLLAGDVDNNEVIDEWDAMTIGMNYNTITPTAADLNNDGIINFIDLEILAANYRKTGPIAWQ